MPFNFGLARNLEAGLTPEDVQTEVASWGQRGTSQPPPIRIEVLVLSGGA